MVRVRIGVRFRARLTVRVGFGFGSGPGFRVRVGAGGHRAAEGADHPHGARGHEELVPPDVLPVERGAAVRGAPGQG